jgi:hypothetical protein
MEGPKLIILIPSFIFACSSCLLSLLTCIIFIRKRDLGNSYAHRLIFIISLTDVLIWGNQSFNYFFYLVRDNDLEDLSYTYCVISSVFRCFNGLINLYCIFLIGLSIYVNRILRKDPLMYEKPAYIIIFVLSIVISFTPAILGRYGKLDNIQCWIPDPITNFLVYYLTVIFVLVLNTFFIIRVILKQWGTAILRELISKISLYPIILLISWFPGIIKIMTGIDHPIIVVFTYCCMPLQGILNPFIYGQIHFRRNSPDTATAPLNLNQDNN